MNLQGEKSSIYYAYSKDLKNIGAQFAFPTAVGPDAGDKAAVVVLATRSNETKQTYASALNLNTGVFDIQTDSKWVPATLTGTPVDGSIIGEVTFTIYVRFHARATNKNIKAPMAIRDRAAA